MEQIKAQRGGTIGRGFCISDAKEGKSFKTVLTWYKMYRLEMPIDSEHYSDLVVILFQRVHKAQIQRLISYRGSFCRSTVGAHS